jgi:hypothetical protein|tara:strand:- start:236 stop:520 length:285 start_codon:yes stop_codon:yes gene_type:complete
MRDPSIGYEHYAKAALATTEAETLLRTAQITTQFVDGEIGVRNIEDPHLAAAQVQSNIALAHAMMSATAYEGYMLDRLIDSVNGFAAAVRVAGS